VRTPQQYHECAARRVWRERAAEADHCGAYRRYCELLAATPGAPPRWSCVRFVAWWEARAERQ
jgi:hypothetical protein